MTAISNTLAAIAQSLDAACAQIPALWLAVLAGMLLCAWAGYGLGRRTGKSPAAPTREAATAIWHVLSAEQAVMALASTPDRGLDAVTAAQRLEAYGPNRLIEKPPRSAGSVLAAQFKSLLIVVLMIAAIVAALIGDLSDGVVILVVVVINALLGFYQEYQAEKSLSALKKMLALQARVKRNGTIQAIPAEQLAPGDWVILEAGDKVPADGRIVKMHTLEVDESSLTGESVPVAKQSQALAAAAMPLAERSNMLYMNTAITRGRAEMLVTATGMATEIGKLANLLSKAEDSATPLQIQLDSLGKRLAMLALLIVVALSALALSRGAPWIDTAFTAIALAVAAIPEGLPAVVTVTLALGMRRMAKQRAIVKRLAAVETLGCTTVICTDKTGTLTVNQMTARAVYYRGQSYRVTGEGYDSKGEILTATGRDAPSEWHDLLPALILCNNSQLRGRQVIGDPMEAALLVLAQKGGLDGVEANRQQPRIAEIPFDAAHKFMATFHRDIQTDTVTIYVKGAPELLLQRCGAMLNAHGAAVPIAADALHCENERMAATGLRVLGVATRTLPGAEYAPDQDLFRYLVDLTFIALVGLMDPPRAEARAAIAQCRTAGIAVKMITGDQKITATAIADELGLNGEVLEGHELAALDDRALSALINAVAVFARTAPEQKVRIVNALKADGHVVAMTGDGVNDAPALKNADIGIAMGITGTDVAQEAATMVLTDDNFATIIDAIREGRGIYENMVKFVRFQLSTNIGAILTVAGAPLLGLPMPFTAVQLLWINIIMDGPPALSLGVDPCHAGSMNEAPRDPEARILSLRRLGNLLSYGVVMAIGTLGVLFVDLQTHARPHAVTLAFTTFVLFQAVNVFNARSEKRSAFNRHFFSNRMLWLALAGVMLLQAMVVHWPVAQPIFHTTDLTATDWLIAGGVASSVLVLEETRKLLIRWLNGMARRAT